MTRSDLAEAWKHAGKHGWGEAGNGICIETGWQLNDVAEGNGEPERFDEDAMYITTDNGIEPILVCSLADAEEELRDQFTEEESI